MEKFSIIIPTMWKSELIYQMLLKYNASEFVAEIIIISNSQIDADLLKVSTLNLSKVIFYSTGRNNYVNAAWNVGSMLAKYTVVLANDDIIIHNIDLLFLGISLYKEYDLIGATVNNLANFKGIISWDKEKGFPRKSFGCFMVCRNYYKIPEVMKILCGDNWLFDHAKLVGIIGAGYIQTPISVTIKSDPEFLKIGLRDKDIYRGLFNIVS